MAGHLGKTVEELGRTMTARELMEWDAYYRIDPWGGHRSDIQSAIVAYTVYSAQGGDKLGLDEFMPNFEPERQQKQQSVQEMQARILVATGAKING